jgi:hypothetical protein
MHKSNVIRSGDNLTCLIREVCVLVRYLHMQFSVIGSDLNHQIENPESITIF